MKRSKKLSKEERIAIYRYRRIGCGIREIAATIDRAPSTVSRELKRNGSILDRSSDYFELAYAAQGAAHERRSKASHRMRLKNAEIREYVEIRLKRMLTPELISGRLTVEHPELRISKEAIYQWILHERQDLRSYLLVASKSRRRRNMKRRKRFKAPAAAKTSIEQRPEAANLRLMIGHFEVDSVVSRQGKSAVQNIADRKTRKVFLSKVSNLESASYSEVLINRLKRDVPKSKVHTITADNGPENAGHLRIDEALGTKSFFCHPYCASERGTVENRNGILRWFFPRGSNFDDIPEDYIQYVEDFINNRPMKCLGYRTPNEVWQQELAA